jgi:hypothetical protein
MNAVLLAGLDSSGNIQLAKFASSYAGTQPLEVLSGVVLGAGKKADGSLVLLKLSGGGEWLT